MINKLTIPLLSLSRPVKRMMAMSLDIFLCVLTVWLALCLRLEGGVALQTT